MDEIDRKIINKLKGNGRVTWKNLGKEIHMTGQAIGARVERLIEDKYIKRFTVDVADKYTEFVTVYMNTQEYRTFENRMVSNPDVESVHKISGDGCYLLITHFLPDEMNDFLTELLTYGRYKINVSLNRLK
ncbi:MAG: Lrp/AsnC family transcriptional regulator [Sporolactobacillus sp.]